MRVRLVIVLFFFTISVCHAQNKIKKRVPLLRESPKIDSLISSLIPEYLKAAKNDSCLILRLTENDVERFVLGTHTLKHRETIFDLGGYLKNDQHVGYFEFHGYLIFVVGDAFMNKFFAVTNKQKEFTFIKPESKDVVAFIRDYMSWAILYNDGNLNYGVH